MDMSIIIVAYNSEEVIWPCLQSIDKMNVLGEELEVIVVDNGPCNTLGNRLKEHSYGFKLQYVFNQYNRGFGAGNNVGARMATGKVIMFLNPDTLLKCDIFTPTLQLIQKNANEVVGYTLTDTEGKRVDSYSFFFEHFWLFPLLRVMQRRNFHFVNSSCWANRLCWPWGAAFSMSRSAFCQAGMFDERIFLCNEEPDLMHRLPLRHITILPEQIVHLEGHGKEVSEERYYQSLCSLQYYFRKYEFWQSPYWLMFKLRLHFRPVPPNLHKAYKRFKKDRKA